MNKNLKEYPPEIQHIVKTLKNSFSIGEFYSSRFYAADDIKIAEVLLKSYNNSNKCSCWKCQGLKEDPYGE